MALAVKAKDFQRLIILSKEKTSNRFKDGSKWIVQTYSTNMKKRPYTTNAFNAFILGFVVRTRQSSEGVRAMKQEQLSYKQKALDELEKLSGNTIDPSNLQYPEHVH